MKNLKKVLSLALAFAMVLGLCVTGMAAEDVTTAADWDSVTDKDAALLLNAFEIMEGSDEDGVLMFNPENNVTRAEAAAMISRALWGGKDTPELYANGNVGAYIDVDTAMWYMGYVNFMTVKGIMVGDGDGEFRPTGDVTGYELLKMCLVAVGYDAETEGLTGLGWDLRTMALATQRGYKDLTEGTTVTDWNAPLSRMNAATIIANMVYREMVAYDDGKLVVITDDTVTPAVEQTFGTYVLEMDVVSATLVANQYGIADDYIVAKDVKGVNPLAADSENNAYVYVTGKDAIPVNMTSELLDLGTPVNLYYVEDELISASVAGWDSIAAVKKNNVITNWDDVVSTESIGTGKLSYKDVTYADFDADGKIDLETTQTYTNIAKVTAVIETENFGTVYQLGDAKWNTKNDKENTAFPTGGFIQASESNIEAAEGDYITYSTIPTVFDKATYTYGYVLTPVEGEVTRVVVNNFGTTYHIDGAPFAGTADATGISFGKEGTFYLYPNSSIASYVPVEGEEVATTYAMLYDAGYETYGSGTGLSGSNGVIVEVMAILQDGTVDTYEVNSITIGDGTYLTEKLTHTDGKTVNDMTGTKKDGSDATAAKFFLASGGALEDLNNGKDYLVTYTLTEDGTMNITGVVKNNGDTTISGDSGKVTSGVATVATAGGDKYFTASTVNFVQTQAEVKGKTETWVVYTGTATPTYTIKTGKTVPAVTADLYAKNDGIAVTVIAADAIEYETTTTTASFFYVIKNAGQIDVTSNGDAIYELTVYDTETNEVEVVESITGKTGFYSTYNSDTTGYDGGLKTPEYGFIDSFKGNLLNLVDVDADDQVVKSTIVEVNKETKYYLIDGEDTTEITADDISAQVTVADSVDKADTPWNDAKDTYQAIVTADNLVIVFADVQGK